MRNMTETELTETVLERYSSTPDPRLRGLLASLITHLHAVVRETRPTEAEWMAAVEFLTATGQKCDAERQEMILLSDNLGISALVNLVAEEVPDGATETTVLGPFFVEGAPDRDWGESIALRRSDKDETLVIHGRVVGLDQEPIPDAALEVWQTDTNGMYDIQDPEQPKNNLRGRYHSNYRGQYRIDTIRPTKYPIPTDGPVGDLLRLTNRHPWRPGHVHAMVFAVKESLIKEFHLNEDDSDARTLGVDSPFRELWHDFVLTKA